MRPMLGRLLWLLTLVLVPGIGIVAAGEHRTERLLFLLMGLVYGVCLGSYLAFRPRSVHIRGLRKVDFHRLRPSRHP